MTMIKFSYNDSYGQPSRGSLAFMPHRRHAANETEILPKPFTVPLLNGETTVNLQPNSSSWVWIITEYFENNTKSFYTTIPDQDGILDHTELVHISPSSIPAAYDAVEPAWWAEMRQYKTVVSDTLLKSGEALTEAQEAIETGRESIERTQHNASLAKAYFEQSRDYSYDSKDYRDEAKTWRDEAQEQADRAASGPESAAQRAENAATRSETARDRAVIAEDDSRVNAAEARADATTAQTAASNAVNARSQATSEANRAEIEADRAQGYANDLLTGPQEYLTGSQAARDDAQAAQTAAETARDDAATSATTAQTARDDAQAARDDAATSAVDANNSADRAENAATLIENQIPGAWTHVSLLNGWTPRPALRQRITPLGIQYDGGVDGSDATSNVICELPEGVSFMETSSFIASATGGHQAIQYNKTTRQLTAAAGTSRISFTIIIPLT